MTAERFFIVGGAGFIGSHFAEHLLTSGRASAVTVYDNFTSGREWHLDAVRHHAGLTVVRGDVHETDRLTAAMDGHDTVIHLASNPDIALAARDPDVDFREGTELTRNVVEAMRKSATKRVIYASGSGIYGDLGDREATEDHGPLVPISPYGASKLAGEALISAYAYMFDIRGCVFRFGNVIGRRQTHGVGYDFIRKLRDNPDMLHILGDGRQSKSYIHVSDVMAAVLTAHSAADRPFQAYNVCTGDYITVTDIAHIVGRCMGLSPRLEYGGGDRGWKGDVPVMRLNTDRIRSLGWTCAHTSAQAMERAVRDMLADLGAEAPVQTA